MLRRLCNVLVFLVLTIEDEYCFEGRWSTPMRAVWNVLSWPLPGVHIWLLDAVTIAMLAAVAAGGAGRGGRVRPIDRAVVLSLVSVGVWAAYGLSSGGSGINMRLQLHTHVMMLLTALVFLGVYRTPRDFVAVGRIVVYAALFRAAMALAFYVWVVRRQFVFVQCVLDHGDSITFVMGIIAVVARALHAPKPANVLRALAVSAFLTWAIMINNRRLAWVGLIGAGVVLYALASAGSARRRLHRAIAIAIPVLIVYVAVGWGRTERIFKPLAAFQSIGPDSKDLSTESRELENLGLVNTVKAAPVVGLGFGKEYLEVSDELAPKDVFPMYRYVPHNSVVGLAAFMGGVGFFGVWLVFPVTAYFAARAYRFSTTPDERTIAACAAAEVFVHINQMYGDIGINATQSLVAMPLAIAAASRIAVSTGAWPGRPAAKTSPSAAAPSLAGSPSR